MNRKYSNGNMESNMLRWASRFTWFYRLVWLQPFSPHCLVGQGSLHCSGSTFSFFSPGDIVALPRRENYRSIPENEVPEHYLHFLHIFKFKTGILESLCMLGTSKVNWISLCISHLDSSDTRFGLFEFLFVTWNQENGVMVRVEHARDTVVCILDSGERWPFYLVMLPLWS